MFEDVQFAFGLTFPTPGTFFTTGGRPPFIPDLDTPTNSNEPYLDVSIRCTDTIPYINWDPVVGLHPQ